MTASPAMVGPSTYSQRLCDDSMIVCDMRKVESQEGKRTRLTRMVACPMLVATTLSSLGEPHAGHATAITDYSIVRYDNVDPNHAGDMPTSALHASPLFQDSYNEMESYKALKDGWDGVSSESISTEVVDVALEFLKLLPPDVSPPEASASGDGTVDWYWRNDRFAATVTFHQNAKITYFAMTDAKPVKGTFEFDGTVPGDLIESLRRL